LKAQGTAQEIKNFLLEKRKLGKENQRGKELRAFKVPVRPA